jgi:hypothetical protein
MASKAQKKRAEAIVADLNRTGNFLREAAQRVRNLIVEITSDFEEQVKPCLDRADDAAANAESEAEGFATEMQDSYDEKSEKWQEGDNGQMVAEAISRLEEVSNLDRDWPSLDLTSLETVADDLESRAEEYESAAADIANDDYLA